MSNLSELKIASKPRSPMSDRSRRESACASCLDNGLLQNDLAARVDIFLRTALELGTFASYAKGPEMSAAAEDVALSR